MKKRILLLSLIAVFMVTGCSKTSKNSTVESKKTAQTVSEIKESSADQTSESTEISIDDSSIDDIRKENPQETVSQLRRELYEAGINSSQITDSELVQYKKEATENGIEFTEYVADIIKD
ncbi:hypothetical protein ACYSNW_14970 [Enterococcus sp. LJL99]